MYTAWSLNAQKNIRARQKKEVMRARNVCNKRKSQNEDVKITVD